MQDPIYTTTEAELLLATDEAHEHARAILRQQADQEPLEDFLNRPVTVDPGDLTEVCDAANAWASELRARARAKAGRANLEHLTAAADRIDLAAHNCRSAKEANNR